MTQEEKAIAYDEALRYAMIYYKEGNEDMKMMMKTCFPALVEDEDERIRKAIIEYLRQRLDRSPSIPAAIGSWIAWLEKQGREKPKRMISAEAKEAMYDKPAWSEEDEKEYKYVLRFVDNILNNCGNKKDYEHCKRCYDWLKSLKERIGG